MILKSHTAVVVLAEKKQAVIRRVVPADPILYTFRKAVHTSGRSWRVQA